jgi:hypothetical protein
MAAGTSKRGQVKISCHTNPYSSGILADTFRVLADPGKRLLVFLA